MANSSNSLSYQDREDLNSLLFNVLKVLTFACSTVAVTFAVSATNASDGLANVAWAVAAFVLYTMGTALVAAKPKTRTFQGSRRTQGASFVLTSLMLTPAFVMVFFGQGVIVKLLAAMVIAICTHMLADNGYHQTGRFFQQRKQLMQSLCLGIRSVLTGALTAGSMSVGIFGAVIADLYTGNGWLVGGSLLTGLVFSVWGLLALTRTTDQKADNYAARYTQLLVSEYLAAVGFLYTIGSAQQGDYLTATIFLAVIALAANRLTKITV